MSDSFIEGQDELKESVLAHYGTPRRSGRFPWGSGDTPYQRAGDFVSTAAALRKQGLKETDIAAYFGMNTTELRARQADAKNYKRQQDIAQVRKLREKGMSISAIEERTGIAGTQVRAYLKPGAEAKATKVQTTVEALKQNVDQHKYIDYGKGTEELLNCSTTQLNQAVQTLKDQGYESHTVYIRQLGVKGKEYTELKVLCPPGTPKSELMANKGLIRAPGVVVNADGIASGALRKPTSIDSGRLTIRYGDEGGTDMDGVIQLRRGVKDLDLGDSHYAQVRIAVDGTHYLKGMAIYTDDLPDGVDVRFNTNKHRKDAPGKLDSLKPMKETGTDNNPFGAVIKRQVTYKDRHGKEKLSPLNIVNEEGDWDKWSRSLASQMLSKQRVGEAQRQLKITRDKAQAEYDEIMSLTNPVVRRKLLLAHAESMDSKSVSLKAAAYPRQAAQVILPIPKMKETEIYAPNFRHGEKVVLIRYPHGGQFEIPELTVNNKSKDGIAIMGKKAMDAVGIHPSVAERLSGADFDGDNVVVIPNNAGHVKTHAALDGLKGFDPKAQYKATPGMKVLTKGKSTQLAMGDISNLITDMQIKGATPDEVARAVRHSMVVIDAAKHKLNYKQSEIDNGISELKAKYQGGARKGASTIISQASGAKRIDERRKAKASEGGPIDPKTGEVRYVKTGKTHDKYKKNPDGSYSLVKTGIKNETITTKMAATKDARTLVSSAARPIEIVYANHANQLKAMANRARKASLEVVDIPYSPTARKTYAAEVESVRAKLSRAYKNKPMERQAQALANAAVDAQKRKHPDLDSEELAKAERVALADARARIGSSKYKMELTHREWEAIQAGAVRKNMLEEVVANADADHIKALALPHKSTALSPAQARRAATMLETHTTAEVADALGVSTSTIRALAKDGD